MCVHNVKQLLFVYAYNAKSNTTESTERMNEQQKNGLHNNLYKVCVFFFLLLKTENRNGMSFAFLYSMSKMRKGRYIENNFVEPFVMQSILMSVWCCCCCCYHYEYYYIFLFKWNCLLSSFRHVDIVFLWWIQSQLKYCY